MKMIWIPLGLILAPVVALAQDPTATQSASPTNQRQQVVIACAIDIQSLCPDVQPGGGRIAQCLRTNAAKVSAPCRDAFKEMRAARSAQGR